MRVYLKRTLAIISLIVLPLIFVMVTQNRVDHNTLRIQGFYQEAENTIDVALIGASDVFTGYSPAYAYKLYGFTSYNYAIDANYTGLFKNQIKEILAHQRIKCLVIETTGCSNSTTKEEKEVSLATMRKWTDAMPFSQNKVDTINQFADSDKLSYYLPFLMYHGQLSNFTDTYKRISQKVRGFSYLKGITSTNKKAPCENMKDISKESGIEKLSIGDEEVFADLLDYCDTLDCRVVFVRFPHRVVDDSELHALKVQNYIEKLVKERGYDFINFDKMFSDLNLSPNDDFYGDSHMNVNGQKKMTSYLGKLLSDKYKISKTELTKENQKRWNTSVEYTEQFYKYFKIHEKDEQVYWWQETPELLKQLESMK